MKKRARSTTPRKPRRGSRRILSALSARIRATAMLQLRTLDDAPFALELVNEPNWPRFMGEKGVGTLDDARRYIESGPWVSYAATRAARTRPTVRQGSSFSLPANVARLPTRTRICFP